MVFYVLFIIAIHRDSEFSARFHPSLAYFFFFLQMEQMVLFTQMKSSGHLCEHPPGGWKIL